MTGFRSFWVQRLVGAGLYSEGLGFRVMQLRLQEPTLPNLRLH